MKKILIAGVCFLLMLFMVGCGSDAEVEEEPIPEVAPPVEDVIPTEDFTEKNTALIAKITETRQEAINEGAEIYFSEQMVELDGLSTNALDAYENGGDGKEFFDTASDMLKKYEALTTSSTIAKIREEALDLGAEKYYSEELKVLDEKNIAVLEKIEEKNYDDFNAKALKAFDDYSVIKDATIAMNAREKAIENHANEYFPNELQVVDIFASEGLAVYQDGGNKQDFDVVANDSLYQYKALEQAAMIAKNQEKIDALDFEQYAPDAYARGVEASNNAMTLFNSGADGETIYNETVKACSEFDAVLIEGYTVLAKEKKTEYLETVSMANEIKANLADKENYLIATATCAKADAELKAKKPEQAFESFELANLQMAEVYNRVYEKRQAAESYLNRAKQSVKRADEIAEKADSIAPQTEESVVEGEE